MSKCEAKVVYSNVKFENVTKIWSISVIFVNVGVELGEVKFIFSSIIFSNIAFRIKQNISKKFIYLVRVPIVIYYLIYLIF